MTDSYLNQLESTFHGVLRWHQLDDLWQQLKASEQAWYIYQVGSDLPDVPLKGDELNSAINSLDELLRLEHDYDYCGIVYVNNQENPDIIKVFDPNNLGSSCGCSGKKHYPRWVISKIKPELIKDDAPLPNQRKRWWRKLLNYTKVI